MSFPGIPQNYGPQQYVPQQYAPQQYGPQQYGPQQFPQFPAAPYQGAPGPVYQGQPQYPQQAFMPPNQFWGGQPNPQVQQYQLPNGTLYREYAPTFRINAGLQPMFNQLMAMMNQMPPAGGQFPGLPSYPSIPGWPGQQPQGPQFPTGFPTGYPTGLPTGYPTGYPTASQPTQNPLGGIDLNGLLAGLLGGNDAITVNNTPAPAPAPAPSNSPTLEELLASFVNGSNDISV
ncbi:MAG: hypothetical protein KC474_00075 [Cyanobacteria bacterium HKST-UBA04]|nr:hypothetical protein [Cyanobacteria bacterium HKST-UBA04]MCA9842475.1 hypothetical protein [Cyanobacteria bacterium HKST-UBA03]